MKDRVSTICNTILTLIIIAIMVMILFITGIGDLFCSLFIDDEDNDYKGDFDEYED